MKTAISFILLTDWCSLTIIYLILPTIHDKKQFITRKMYIHKYVYRYNKMLSLVISVEYEGSDIAENIFFYNVSASISRMNHQRQHFFKLVNKPHVHNWNCWLNEQQNILCIVNRFTWYCSFLKQRGYECFKSDISLKLSIQREKVLI